MSTRAGLIAAILNDPADDTPRLIFADFLQENGEPERAEFIRLQIEAEHSTKPAATKKKAAKLAEKHALAWRGPLGLADFERKYRRGFLTGVGLYSNEFAAKAAAILAIEPVTFSLDLYAHGAGTEKPVTLAEVGRLADNSHLKAVTRIWSQNGGWGPKKFARLMKSPHLVNLKTIEFFEDAIGHTGVRAIVESPSGFVLEHLDLNESLQYQDYREKPSARKAVELIAASPRFASLKHLGLMFNSVSQRSAEALLASHTLQRTLHLEIDENPCEDETPGQFAERFTGIPPADDED